LQKADLLNTTPVLGAYRRYKKGIAAHFFLPVLHHENIAGEITARLRSFNACQRFHDLAT